MLGIRMIPGESKKEMTVSLISLRKGGKRIGEKGREEGDSPIGFSCVGERGQRNSMFELVGSGEGRGGRSKETSLAAARPRGGKELILKGTGRTAGRKVMTLFGSGKEKEKGGDGPRLRKVPALTAENQMALGFFNKERKKGNGEKRMLLGALVKSASMLQSDTGEEWRHGYWVIYLGRKGKKRGKNLRVRSVGCRHGDWQGGGKPVVISREEGGRKRREKKKTSIESRAWQKRYLLVFDA